jgi:hypothetical protein
MPSRDIPHKVYRVIGQELGGLPLDSIYVGKAPIGKGQDIPLVSCGVARRETAIGIAQDVGCAVIVG